MMMEKPRPKEQVPVPPPKEQKKKSAEEAVQELEKRLAALGGPSPPVAAAVAPVEESNILDLSAPAVTAPAPAEQSKGVKGGKNALLARIMAAQEKAKTTTPPPLPQQDLLGPAPTLAAAPPPAYDAGLLPPPAEEKPAPPPAFDAVENHVMAQVQPPDYSVAPPPPPAVVTPSAPAFEDLLGVNQATGPPPSQEVMAPPSPEEEIIMGMEGLSPEERKALLEEQRKIMDQIEREKSANHAAIASAQADNFDMRSTTNAVNAMAGGTRRLGASSSTQVGSKVNLGGGQEVALHGPERTKEAIKDGTAVLIQCVNCDNWMQVTGNATLMYCPVCGVVSPVDKNGAAMSKDEAMQMEADRKMAEQLQNEEYKQAAEPAPRRVRQQAPKQAEESWWDTVSNMFSSEKTEQPAAQPTARSSSESQAFVGGSGGGGRPAARVAEQKPLFSCVVDSVNSTVGTLTGTQLSQDAEGNVHGVDSTSLLAVSNVGRETGYRQVND